MSTPATLPANFFTVDPNAGKKGIPNAPDTLPADFDFNSALDKQFDANQQRPGMQLNPVQRFLGHAAERMGDLVPGIARTGGELMRHPIQTPLRMMQNMADTPYKLVNMVKNGQGPEAAEEAAEFMMPLISRGVGSLAERGSYPLAETAMRVGKRDTMFDANPGRAILSESKSLRPASVASDLEAKGLSLARQQDANAANSTTPASLVPPLTAVSDRIARARGAGGTATADALEPMRGYFEGEAPQGFSGATMPGLAKPLISPTQSPSQLLQMRREFVPNFKVKYGQQDSDSPLVKTGREAYRAMSDEFKRTVPGATELDGRMHDIMAAQSPAESTSRNAGLGQNLVGRVAAKTGSLAGALAGYHYGGVPGAAAGLILPEIAGSPVTQMVGARALYGAGRALQNPSLTIPATLAGKSLVRPNQVSNSPAIPAPPIPTLDDFVKKLPAPGTIPRFADWQPK